MMFIYFLLIIPYVVSGDVLSNISPCKITDITCLESSANVLFPLFTVGNPELGIESSDPLLVEKIEANLPMIKYSLYNVTVIGFKDCVTTNLQVTEDLSKLRSDLNCPKFTLNGQYDVSGQLITLPVEGSGDFSVTTGKYVVTTDYELKITQGKDGKRHLAVKSFKLKCNPLEPVLFQFSNLFNGQKDLSDAFHKFASENWKEATDLLQEPIWYGNMKKLMSNINKYMKQVAIEDVVTQ